MLCLRCGKREQFADNLCENCILETITPVEVKPVVHGTVCPSCNRILHHRSWEECPGNLPDAVLRIAADSLTFMEGLKNPDIELSVDSSDSNTFRVSGKVRTNYKGLLIEQEIGVEVRISNVLCTFCSRKSGNYFEAIIQIRGLDGFTREEVDRILEGIRNSVASAYRKDPNVFITREEEVRGGWDLYMGDNSFAKQLSQKLHDTYGGETKLSSSLFGRKDGRDVYRYTYLVRFPGFLQGDYLIREGEPLKIEKIARVVKVRSLRTGREENLNMHEAMSLRKLRKADVEMELIIVSRSGDEVQVLHPTSFRTVEMLLGGRSAEEETITGALIDGELYLV